MLNTLSSAPVAERVLALRMRPDLEVGIQHASGKRLWIVKDPIALKYFHLREEEHAILVMLDGRVSLDEIRRRFEREFAPRSLNVVDLHHFLGRLHRDGLVVATATGQGEQLLERRGEQRRKQRLQAIVSVLAIRLRGVNPSRFLDWLEPKVGWIFSPLALCVGLSAMIAALTLVLVEFDAFHARLPDARTFLSASNLPWLFLVLAMTKILHELGHAVACRRLGAECHEIGFMLLVFAPCLYCNVTDSWMLESKWRRVLVAAAGMVVELILASVCTLLWWFSQPGLFNALCLDTVIICSVSTVLFNGNPLLRYDGYFILSDLTETPNLSQRASAAVRRLLARVCLGMNLPDDSLSPPGRQGWLVAYAVASTVYRWMLVSLILWSVFVFLKPHNLEGLAATLAGVVVAGLLWAPAAAVIRVVREPGRRSPIARARAAVTLLLLLAAGVAFFTVPLPMRISAPVVMEFRDASRVYVTVPGRLTTSVRVGDRVEKGSVLARLTNESMEMDLAKLASQRDQQRIFLADLEARRLAGIVDGSAIPVATAALADLDARLAELTRDAERLTIVAPAPGVVLPPPSQPRKPPSADKLDPWMGQPFDERNQGAYFETGTLLCLVGDPERFEAVAHVEGADVELIDVGAKARIMLDHRRGEVLSGSVAQIAKLDVDVMPRELAAAGDIPTRVDSRGVARPSSAWYQARVIFEQVPSAMLAGVHGRAKIDVAPRSLGWRFLRFLRQTFNR